MPWVYILECRDKRLYVGSAMDLRHRFAQHCRGESGYTRRRRPLLLAWLQEFERIDDAFVVEHQVKGWGRKKKLALIEGRFDVLHGMATWGEGEVELSEETRRWMREATELLRMGRVPADRGGFVAAPLDALTKRGSRVWRPRAGRERDEQWGAGR